MGLVSRASRRIVPQKFSLSSSPNSICPSLVRSVAGSSPSYSSAIRVVLGSRIVYWRPLTEESKDANHYSPLLGLRWNKEPRFKLEIRKRGILRIRNVEAK